MTPHLTLLQCCLLWFGFDQLFSAYDKKQFKGTEPFIAYLFSHDCRWQHMVTLIKIIMKKSLKSVLGVLVLLLSKTKTKPRNQHTLYAALSPHGATPWVSDYGLLSLVQLSFVWFFLLMPPPPPYFLFPSLVSISFLINLFCILLSLTWFCIFLRLNSALSETSKNIIHKYLNNKFLHLSSNFVANIIHLLGLMSIAAGKWKHHSRVRQLLLALLTVSFPKSPVREFGAMRH